MTFKQLEKQHRKEMDYYLKGREQRLSILEKDQKTIVQHCLIGNSTANKLLRGLLAEQRKMCEEMEKDELDMLLHIQELERKNLLEKEEQREKLREILLSSNGYKDRER